MNPDHLRAELDKLPLIDNHCHFYRAQYQPHDLAAVLNLSVLEMPEEQLRQTMIYRLMLRELGRYLDLGGAPDAEILARREELMGRDYQAWVSGLLGEAGVKALLVDTGYSPAAQPREDFEAVHPCGVYYIFRMETVLDHLWEEYRQGRLNLRAVEERYYPALEEGLALEKAIALKSIIGYRTGLEVEPVERSVLLDGGADEKRFRDYFLFQTLEHIASRNLPVQIHAAFGESHIDIRRNHPAMLKYVLDQSRFRDLPLVLVHGGYPRCFEAGFLASTHPNVYVDLSEMIPFVPIGARQGVMDILNMCPANKILYGSDGFLIPEIHWLGSRMIREIMTSILWDLMECGIFGHEQALDTACLIFAENARRLYNLEMT